MGLEAGNPVVGGTVLRRAAIQSPNFVHKVSGWNVGQDGSAEFNNVVIRNGQVISGTALFYSGVPATGNLIASIAAAGGTDDFGNTFFAGISSYTANLIANLAGGAFELFVTGETGSASIEQDLDGAGHFAMFLQSPQQGTAAVLMLIPSQWGSKAVPQVLIAGTNGNPVPGTTSLLEVQGQISTTALANIVANGGLIAQLGDIVAQAGNLIANTIGKGLEIATGANGRLVKATLAAGTVTVANTTVTANTQIFVNHISIGANAGVLGYTLNPGVGFTINSTNAADANSVSCLLVERL